MQIKAYPATFYYAVAFGWILIMTVAMNAMDDSEINNAEWNQRYQRHSQVDTTSSIVLAMTNYF